ncbi:glycosyltransferase family 2 protein [Algoriphagus sp. AGSA1]|uniref:glycosyltransferase family 2 protein n=1 Tax=Algoriphagus sp. AGSA1 TaxID=2907213 RepID=UPI001F306DE1|nr:glycosyltransferase family 2 protein [Algoriphagus sp. AGSA1]MCE7055963.1 glycosyltransferase family 2 protein [Algoriphagus sp. AGSA1]
MPSTPDPSVAIILVNWNGYAFTADCLRSLRKVDFQKFQVILVDNASKDQEGKKLKAEFPEIELVENTKNLGFAGGNNVGIKTALAAGYPHVMLLNNDTVVEPDFLGIMLQKFRKNPNVGVVQPLIIFLHDRKKIWSAGGKWQQWWCRSITLGDRKYIGDFKVRDRGLDWATGCCMLIRRNALVDTGLLNENYFAYFEDVEWSLRFRKKGYEIELASDAVIYHEAGASSKKKHSEGTLSASVFYYHVRNQFYLVRAKSLGIQILFAAAYHLSRFILWMAYFGLRGRFQKLRAVARGIRDGWTSTLQNTEIWS